MASAAAFFRWDGPSAHRFSRATFASMSRIRQSVWAALIASGLASFSTLLLAPSASADTAIAEGRGSPDAGTHERVPDASAPKCADGGCSDADAGSSPEARDDAGDAGEEDAQPISRPTRVSVSSVSFRNGEVPRAQASLERLVKELSACATENGGVKGEGSVELRFLVRARSRAEGVEVGRTRNVSPAVAQCIAWTVARRPMGAPSDEPVFVTAILTLTEEKRASTQPRARR